MRIALDVLISYECGDVCVRELRDEIPRIGEFLTVDLDGKLRRIKVTKVFPTANVEGVIAILVFATVHDAPPPTVRFLDAITGIALAVQQTEKTDGTYHLYGSGDQVLLRDGGKMMVINREILPGNEIILRCWNP